MNYYIEGCAAKAEQIKAAFERLGYDAKGWCFTSGVYYTLNARIVNTNIGSNEHELILNSSDYKELPIEPLFKVGDWLYHNTLGVHPILVEDYSELQGYKVVCRSEPYYWLQKGVVESEYHLWTIADAKDGDVLVDEDTNTIGIFEKAYGICWHSKIYCAKSTYSTMVYHQGGSHEIKFTKPATKEQRDLLFTKMREAGYEWDAEKKGLRKTTEPNFKVGDWVVRKDGTTFYGGNYVEQVKSVTGDEIGLSSGPLVPNCVIRLWTIQDAEDGDVLVSRIDNPFIYNGNIEFSSAGAYVGVSRNGIIRLDMFPSKAWTSIKDVKPATKEQCETLFAKLKEIGYEWDASKKELKKIRPHYGISNFYVDMPVLVRDGDCGEWTHTHFSHVRARPNFRFVAGAEIWRQCIPFDNKTKHLLGTTDMCPEEYINW